MWTESVLMRTANQGCEEAEQCDCERHRSESGASELSPVAEERERQRNRQMER